MKPETEIHRTATCRGLFFFVREARIYLYRKTFDEA
jgi:hypothetical protein